MEEEYSVRNLTSIDIQDDGCAFKECISCFKGVKIAMSMFIVADKDFSEVDMASVLGIRYPFVKFQCIWDTFLKDDGIFEAGDIQYILQNKHHFTAKYLNISG